MWKNALLSLIALALALLAGEAALAFLDRFPPSPRLYPGGRPAPGPGVDEHVDPQIGWKAPPASEIHAAPPNGDFEVTYRTDELGFRATPRGSLAPPEASLRVVFLGDSFTFGIGVEDHETFPYLVGHRLERARAFNFGMSGFGIDQMWLTLRHYAARVEPDVVVLAFILDDLDRTMDAYRWRGRWIRKPAFDIREGRLVRLDETDRPNGLLRAIRRRSRILEGLQRLEDQLSLVWPVGHRWRLNRRIFQEIRDETAGLGAELLVVYLPTKWQQNRPTPVFEAEFGKLGIPFLDLQAALPADRSELYFEHDGHMTPTGHSFVAEQILRELRERGWPR